MNVHEEMLTVLGEYQPLAILILGIVTVVGMIVVLRLNAFIALITGAMLVSLVSEGALATKISRVATAFGEAAGNIGIVIALAAVIGKCMMDSGAADRVVRVFLGMLGEKRASLALMGSGYVLSIPVFFDTVFYLLVPLARSVYRRTGVNYVKYILAIAAGGAVTHTLVPPTPGPLLMASNLNIDIGMMIIVGAMVALPSAMAGLWFASLADRLLNIPMRPLGAEPEPTPLKDDELPSFLASVLPVLLPVLMISTDTVLGVYADAEHAARFTVADVRDWSALPAQLNGAAGSDASSPAARVMEFLPPAAQEQVREGAVQSEQQRMDLVAGLNTLLARKQFYEADTFAGLTLPGDGRQVVDGLIHGLNRARTADVERLNRLLLEGAFPELFEKHTWRTPRRQAADVGALLGNANLALLLSTAVAMWVLYRQRRPSRHEMAHVVETSLMSGGVIILITSGGGAFGKMLATAGVGDLLEGITEGGSGGLSLLLIGFGVAAVIKVAQGSSTVAMITASGMLTSIASADILGFNPVFLATAIGSGSLIGSWMNDSGFWIFAKMGGLTEEEALKSWTILLLVLGVVGLLVTVLLAWLSRGLF